MKREEFKDVRERIQMTVSKAGNWESLVAFMEGFYSLYGSEKIVEFGIDAKLNDRALQVLSANMALAPHLFPTEYKMKNNLVGDFGATALAEALTRIGVNARIDQGLDQGRLEAASDEVEKIEGEVEQDIYGGEIVEERDTFTHDSFDINTFQEKDFTLSAAGGVSINDGKKAKWLNEKLEKAESDEVRHKLIEHVCQKASPFAKHTCRNKMCRVVRNLDVGGFLNSTFSKSTMLTVHSGEHFAYSLDLSLNNISFKGVKELLLACWGGRQKNPEGGEHLVYEGGAPIKAMDLRNQNSSSLSEEEMQKLGKLARKALEQMNENGTAGGIKGELAQLFLVDSWGIGSEDEIVPFFGKESKTWMEDGGKKGKGQVEGRLLSFSDITLISAVLCNHTCAKMLDLSGHDLTSDSLELLSKHVLNRDNNTIEVSFSNPKN